MGSTTVSMGKRQATFQAVALPDIRHEPEIGDGWVRFTQTVGGRTAHPRTAAGQPIRPSCSSVPRWSGRRSSSRSTPTARRPTSSSARAASRGTGSSVRTGRWRPRPGMADFKEWFRHAFGPHTPWGGIDSPALVTEVESALERSMSATIMQGDAKPKIRKLAADELLAEQGSPGKRALPAVGWRDLGGDRRRAAGRGGSGRHPRRARHPRGGAADLDVARRHRGTRRRRRGVTGRPRRAGGAERAASAGGEPRRRRSPAERTSGSDDPDVQGLVALVAGADLELDLLPDSIRISRQDRRPRVNEGTLRRAPDRRAVRRPVSTADGR